MKKLILIISIVCLGYQAWAQEPKTVDSLYQVQPTSQVAIPQQAQNTQGVTVLEPENMVLKAGVENKVIVKLEKTGVNNMILKVVDEELCSMRKGQELGTYYFTPKVKEGNVMIRVGYMDFMGAYFKLADLTFTVVDE
jgi:hypothetical protein